ncbi:NAD-dependent epimerase/dehydratase family protein [Halomarina oriensis]|uniref:NAD-dependent epimerase/dehydratase family protein n=1 Tax=Halomarina oriensis TaxID=671145 RepID=A0A6B0GNP2_9EURY|nr:NAD-dependent epimerase/dehydratase family protein [Halomarina oriensis]MWG36300.1 NAD-dependent epimerase/dehydratase family protein [Halomarina oriensis]
MGLTSRVDILTHRSTPLEDAMLRIDQVGLGLVVLVDDDARLVGTATDGDIRRGILDGVSLDAPVEAVMNEDPVAIRASWDRREVAARFSRTRLEAAAPKTGRLVVPIVDEDDRVTDVTFLSKRGEIAGPTRPSNGSVNTVLVIGGAGYIGSVLCGQLLERGYEIRVLDPLLFGDHGISQYYDDERFTLVEGDMCDIETVMTAIEGADAVVHLGGLVGDPASSLDPSRTLALNLHSVKLVADICKYHQINRFLFASTCSVYGKSGSGDLLTEGDDLNPVSLYARTKIESERELLNMDGNFAPTVLRMATVYGLSPRMRFDLVVNVLNAKAHTEGVVPIFGGDQYRPNVHVADAARAYVACLEAPIETVAHEVFNVGSNAQNYCVEDIGRIVADHYPHASLDVNADREDDRSYRVDFSKLRDVLDYEAEHTIESACVELREAFERGEFEDYTDKVYSNYKTAVEDSDVEAHAD